MAKLDWHSYDIKRETTISENYESTHNVRRFIKLQCGNDFKFGRPFMFWIKNGDSKTMDDVADE